MRHHEIDYEAEERAAYQRGDAALAQLLADCADLHRALEGLAYPGDTGAEGEGCPECTATRDYARAALLKVSA